MENTLLDAGLAERALDALGEQLAARDVGVELAVVGGTALLALGLADRTTQDVDVVALMTKGRLVSAEPLPEKLREARDVVARDLGLPQDWLNAEATSLVELGLPTGFVARAEPRRYGDALTVLFASRYDQIHFKLYATVDQGTGKHLDDLTALRPTSEELVAAARWSRTHDPSPGYLSVLERVLEHFGVRNAPLAP